MSLSNTEKEIECVIHWFTEWSVMQKGDFMKNLLEKAVPNHVDALFDAMHSLNVRDKPPTIFQCQLNLFTQWFETWTEHDRNDFMIRLCAADKDFVDRFKQAVSVGMNSVNGNQAVAS